jgi:hypothetical protein
MRPNGVIYNTLINAHARSRKEGSVEKVEAILAKMNNFKSQGFTDTGPTKITYNSILSTYQKSREDVYEKARLLLQEIEEKKQQIQPDCVTYTTFLNILVRSKEPKKALIAESILKTMEKNPDDSKLRPNNFTYDAVLRICGSPSSNDRQQLRQYLILAVNTLTKAQKSQFVTPTPLTYGAFFLAIAKLSSGQEHAKLLEKSLSDCCEVGVIDTKVLEILIRTTPAPLLQKLLNVNKPPSQVNITDLPAEWSRNSKQGLPTGASQRASVRVVHNTGRQRIRR